MPADSIAALPQAGARDARRAARIPQLASTRHARARCPRRWSRRRISAPLMVTAQNRRRAWCGRASRPAQRCPARATPFGWGCSAAHVLLQGRQVARVSTRSRSTSKAWLLILPVCHVRRFLGDPAADDGRQLLRAGHHLARAPRVRRHRVVQDGDARRRAARRAAAPAHVLARGARRRSSAGDRAGAVDAAERLERVAGAGAARDVAADSVERRRHHLADLRTRRHRPVRRRAGTTRVSTTTTRGSADRRLAYGAADGCLALDVAGRAALLRRPARDSRTPTTRPRRSTAHRAWPCSATSSCRSCAAC